MCREKYLAIDVGETAIKYTLTDKNAETIAAGIMTIQSVLDAEKFCIGGGISMQDILISEIKDSVHDFYSVKFHNP